MTNVADAVGSGIVTSLARPGGNITGDTFFVTELVVKRLEVLKDAIPRVRRVAILVNPDNAGTAQPLQAMEVAAREMNLALLRFHARGPADLDGAFASMAKEGVDALTVPEDVVFIANFKRIAELAIAQRLPSISFLEYADAGGSSATARTTWRSTGAPPSSSTGSSRAPSPPTFRSSGRRRSNW